MFAEEEEVEWGNVLFGDARSAAVRARGHCGSLGLYAVPVGSRDWTGHRLGLTNARPRGNV